MYCYSANFHEYYDARYGAVIENNQDGSYVKYKIITERELLYPFFSHFHPYVSELIRNLIEKSIPGLQDTDTIYQKDDKKNLKTLQGSIAVTLVNSTKITIILPENDETIKEGEVTLWAGASINIVDSAEANFEGETIFLQDGVISLTSSDIMLVKIKGKDEKKPLPIGALITLLHDEDIETKIILPNGKEGILSADTEVIFNGFKPLPELYEEIFSDYYYCPVPYVVTHPYPVKDLDFSSSGSYSVYNWELFYHVPLTIAIHLSKNQRFKEAQQWFHYIFDPTDDSSGPTPERFWKVKPFQYTDVKLIENILVNLSSGIDYKLQQETIDCIGKWKAEPFRPHLIARYRHSAYMFKAVMAYLDNLINWGDLLFRQDNRESINEAMQLYVLAANILGQRPQAVPKKASIRPQTYANLKKDLDEIGNALVEFETDIPFNIMPYPTDASDSDQLDVLKSIGKALYFCVPRNDKLLSYWDTVADRLFKIRNSLNIQGIFRQLPIFEPPIDPALLAKAAAAGLDVGAVISGINKPLPLVRFQLLLQKATEICQEVKSLGGALLSSIEKQDNEALAILRAKHERVILEETEKVKYSQWQEAIKSREGLEKSLKNAIQRYAFYELLLGKQLFEIKIPELEALESSDLEKMIFDMDEPEIFLRNIKVDIPSLKNAGSSSGMGDARRLGGSSTSSAAEGGGAGNPGGSRASSTSGSSEDSASTTSIDDTGGLKLNTEEITELSLLKKARGKHKDIATCDQIAGILDAAPDFTGNIAPIGLGVSIAVTSRSIAAIPRAIANFFRADADKYTYEANKTAKIGSYSRRELDWASQSNAAAGEITQTFKQLRAAQIREAITEWEWNNHKKQIKHAEEIETFLTDEKNGKMTNQAFYTWMKREVKGLYGQCFQFAYDIAKKAERALQHELGNYKLNFIKFDYLAGKEGLLAGEKLYFDLKRMDMAYHDLNKREYELTKHISLLQLDPIALIELRATGKCNISLPEELFDMGCPGHYFRRIKSVAITIPCVTGPYTNINCTLNLQKSSIRTSSLLNDGVYAREGAEDIRFNDHFGSLETIVTSTGQGDSGLFETNLRDERYLPFESSGVISEWQLELPNDIRQFDYDSISDVIMHIQYTAREGGNLLRNGAVSNLNSKIEEAQTVGSVRLFSIRHEFPSEWAKFKADADTYAELTINFREEHYPFWSKNKDIEIKNIIFFAKPTLDTKSNITVANNSNGTDKKDTLVKDNSLNDLRVGRLINIDLPKKSTGAYMLYFEDNTMDELLLALTWGR